MQCLWCIYLHTANIYGAYDIYAAYVPYKEGICDMHGLYASFLAPVVSIIVYVGYVSYLLHMWYTLLVKKVLVKSRVSTARVYCTQGIPYIPAHKTRAVFTTNFPSFVNVGRIGRRRNIAGAC